MPGHSGDLAEQATHRHQPAYALAALGDFVLLRPACTFRPSARRGSLPCTMSGVGLRGPVLDLPAGFLALPLVRRIMGSRPYLSSISTLASRRCGRSR